VVAQEKGSKRDSRQRLFDVIEAIPNLQQPRLTPNLMQQLFRTAHGANKGISVFVPIGQKLIAKLFLFPLGDVIEVISDGPNKRCFISATTSIDAKLDAAII
jgi:hypothetical protein